MAGTTSRGWTLGALVAVVVGVVVALGVAGGWFGGGGAGDGASNEAGMVVRYDGRDYWVSDYYVADSALGPAIASDQPFTDTTVDLREIQGQDPAVTMAAYTPPLSTASPTAGWHLVSTDADYWTDQANVEANSALFDPQP